MDSMKDTLSEMVDSFNKRMADFERELQRTTTSPSSHNTVSLAADFAAFKDFMLKALSSLQKQSEIIAQDVDRLEMRGRRKILLLHGVPEGKQENTPEVVTRIIKDSLKIHCFDHSLIKRCHRMGRASSPLVPRPILFKLQNMEIRNNIWYSKTKLKGSGITISEFLTKSRHSVFMAARQKYGVAKCWTKEGSIYVQDADGARHRVTSHSEMLNIGKQKFSKPTAEKTVPSKTKRTVSTRK